MPTILLLAEGCNLPVVYYFPLSCSLKRGSQMTVGVNSELPSVVRSTALDTLPDEVTVKLEVNPATLDLSSNDRLVY